MGDPRQAQRRGLRRGLPRVPGGEPWPPADAAGPELDPPASVAEAQAAASSDLDAARSDIAGESGGPSAPPSAPGADAGADADAAAAAAAAADVADVASVQPASSTATIAPAGVRRGLPRVHGGEPWPPAGTAPGAAVESATTGSAQPGSATTGSAPTASAPADSAPAARSQAPDSPAPTADVSSPQVAPSTSAGAVADTGVRRGLPRTPGGEPWPPAGVVPSVAPAAHTATTASHTQAAMEAVTDAEAAPSAPAPQAPAGVVARPSDVGVPLRAKPTVWNGTAPRHIAPAPEPARPRPTWTQVIAGLFAAAGLGVLAAAVVAFVRTLLSLPAMQDFLAAYPGEYAPAIAVEPGFAPWIGWQHFFNMFLMVLIIRSGLTIRKEKRPTAFWTPRNNPKGKVSLTIWFHQALDVLWLVNGVIFVVLLFVTGHWVRIVPTSWEVFPNALSAALQYVSFDWPHENGWNNYNSLQQIAYFVTVFIAAPLAAVTGFRMSGLWPKKATALSKAYPIEWARRLHFPVMLYFVAFIIAHVALVFFTGMLANLNHMFASSEGTGWTGFWIFAAAVAVIAAGWAAARPLVIAPIAKVFGTVSGR